MTTAFADNPIAFSRLTNGYWQIWQINPDGTDLKQLTVTAYDKRDPVWTGKNGQFAYRTHNGELFIFDPVSGFEQQILKEYGQINNPVFVPQTGEVIFVRFDPRSIDICDLWKAQSDGKNAVMLTQDRILKYQPAASPDGKSIAYVKTSSTSKDHTIWLMDLASKDIKPLVEESGYNTHPDFSPDGSFLTYTSNRDGNYEIYLKDLKSAQDKRLTSDPQLDTSASISPDGRSTVFVSNRGGNRQLWIMDTDGNNVRQLTTGDNPADDPAWKK